MPTPRRYVAIPFTPWGYSANYASSPARQLHPPPGLQSLNLLHPAAFTPMRSIILWSSARRTSSRPKYAASSTYARRSKSSIRSQIVDLFKMQQMLSQARQMQEEMSQKLSQTIIEASSGGGAVTVKMNGKKEVLKVTIDPAAVASLSGPEI